MSVDLVVTYPGRVDAADAEYPFGKPRNRVSPGDGTPFDEALYRDFVGMMAAAMRQSGITAATNVPEKVGASQMLQGLARHMSGGSNFYEDSGVADAYVIDVPGTLPNVFETPSVLFDGMKVRWLAANANTGASTLDVEFQGSSISSPQSLTLEGGTALTGVEINTTVENEARFDLGNTRWELTKAGGLSAASIFTEEFISSGQTITSAGPLTIAHGLSSQPKLYLAFLECTTADLNYSIGDEIIVGLMSNGSVINRGVSIVPDATNLNIRYGSDSGVFSALNKTTGVGASLTNSSWELILRAWA